MQNKVLVSLEDEEYMYIAHHKKKLLCCIIIRSC